MTSKVLKNNQPVARERLYVFLLAAIQFAHIVDFVVMMPLGPVLMRVFDISPIQFASLVSSYSFSAAVAGVLYGVVADRFDRKTLLLFCFVGFIIGTFLCGVAGNFNLLLAARIVAGCFGGVLNGIVFAMVTDLIPFLRRGAAMGIIMSSFSIASVLGVPIGLAIADNFGWQKTFWFIALFSLPIFFASKAAFPSLKEHIQIKSPLQDFKRFGKLLLNLNYFKSYLLILLISVSSFMLIPFLSPYAVKNVGILESELKYIYLVGGFFTIISSRIIGKATDRFGAYQVFVTMALFSFLPIYLYTSAPAMELIPFLALSALFMTVVSGRFIPIMTLVSEIARSKDRGTFMGLLNSIRALGSALATLAAGAIIVETPGGELEKFTDVGYLSILISLVAIIFGARVNGILKRKRQEEGNEKDNID
ncbi:MAG: MFS transporter [Bacteriovoracaceae bacterium]